MLMKNNLVAIENREVYDDMIREVTRLNELMEVLEKESENLYSELESIRFCNRIINRDLRSETEGICKKLNKNSLHASQLQKQKIEQMDNMKKFKIKHKCVSI